MAKIKVCYLNVFESHLFPITTLVSEHDQPLEIYQTKVGSVGSWCWESAICLAEYCYDHLFNEFHEKRIVEIGSGTGIVGLQLAALGAHVTLTDREEYLELLDYNIRKNNAALTGTAQAKSLFWGDDINDDENCWTNLDFVIVANCVYHSIDLDQLIQTICSLCPVSSSTCVICCYELRNDGIRRLVDEFHEKLRTKQFIVEHIEQKHLRSKYQNDYNAIVKCQRETSVNISM
jgi:protein N-lysine methyltransferase METTL21D